MDLDRRRATLLLLTGALAISGCTPSPGSVPGAGTDTPTAAASAIGPLVFGDSQVAYGDWDAVLRGPTIVHGRPGATIGAMAPEVAATVGPEIAEIVVWLGSNDVLTGRSPDRVRADMDDLLGRIRDRTRDARVVVLSVPPLRGREAEVDAANEALRSAAEAGGARWVDVREALRGRLAGDGVHLTEDGYAVIGPAVRGALGR